MNESFVDRISNYFVDYVLLCSVYVVLNMYNVNLLHTFIVVDYRMPNFYGIVYMFQTCNEYQKKQTTTSTQVCQALVTDAKKALDYGKGNVSV